jgi:hypothetical protein
MPAKIKDFVITTDPGQRFVQSSNAHNFLNCKQFTVFKRLAERHDVYIKSGGKYYPVLGSTVKVVDFGKI